MAQLNPALKIVLKNEGGFVNDPADHGGMTYKGVARNKFPNWSGWWLIDAHIQAGNWPLNNPGPDNPIEIAVVQHYQTLWQNFRAGEIINQEVANIYFDFCVLASSAVRAMQETVNQFGANIAEDNTIGPQTLNAINSIEPTKLVNAFVKKRIQYHQTRVQAGLVDGKYLTGWIRRANRFATTVAEKVTLGIGALLAALGIGYAIKKKLSSKTKKKA